MIISFGLFCVVAITVPMYMPMWAAIVTDAIAGAAVLVILWNELS